MTRAVTPRDTSKWSASLLRASEGRSRGGFYPETDVTVPLSTQPVVAAQWARDTGPLTAADSIYWLRLVTRVPAGTSLERVQDALTPAFVTLLPPAVRASPSPSSIRLVSAARGEPSVGTGERPLLILTGAVVLILLIACLNVATLLLARGVARQREIAVRRAVGASRVRVMRELPLESVVLAAVGSLAGVLVAVWSRDALGAMFTAGFATSGFGAVRIDMPIDWLLVATAVAIAIVTAIVCGLLPTLRRSRVDGATLLNQRAAVGMPALTIGRALLALQIAVSVPMLTGALLFLRTVGNLASVDLGFVSSRHGRGDDVGGGGAGGRHAGAARGARESGRGAASGVACVESFVL